MGMTPLHAAAECSRSDAIKVLVAAGVDLSAKTMLGQTPAQVANWNGHTEAARYLVEKSV